MFFKKQLSFKILPFLFLLFLIGNVSRGICCGNYNLIIPKAATLQKGEKKLSLWGMEIKKNYLYSDSGENHGHYYYERKTRLLNIFPELSIGLADSVELSIKIREWKEYWEYYQEYKYYDSNTKKERLIIHHGQSEDERFNFRPYLGIKYNFLQNKYFAFSAAAETYIFLPWLDFTYYLIADIYLPPFTLNLDLEGGKTWFAYNNEYLDYLLTLGGPLPFYYRSLNAGANLVLGKRISLIGEINTLFIKPPKKKFSQPKILLSLGANINIISTLNIKAGFQYPLRWEKEKIYFKHLKRYPLDYSTIMLSVSYLLKKKKK
jgi:hypothetical protein